MAREVKPGWTSLSCVAVPAGRPSGRDRPRLSRCDWSPSSARRSTSVSATEHTTVSDVVRKALRQYLKVS